MGNVLARQGFEPLLRVVVEVVVGEKRECKRSIVTWWCEVAVEHGFCDDLKGFGPSGLFPVGSLTAHGVELQVGVMAAA